MKNKRYRVTLYFEDKEFYVRAKNEKETESKAIAAYKSKKPTLRVNKQHTSIQERLEL